MNAIKDFLIAHGEKVVGGIIVVICLWAIATNLFRDSERLIVPDGLSQPVQEESVSRSLRQVRDHLQDEETKSVWKDPEVPDVTEDVLEAHAQYLRPIDDPALQFLTEPSEPAPRTTFRVTDLPSGEDGGDAYLTRTAPPVEWEVRSGEAGVLVVCADNEALNWPAGVRVALYRRRVGSGDADLSASERSRLQHRRAPELAERMPEEVQQPSRQPTGDIFGSDDPFGGDQTGGGWYGSPGDTPSPQQPSGETATETEEEEVPSTVPERLAKTRETFLKDVRVAAGSSGLSAEGWTLVTDSMPAFSKRPVPESVLKAGELPAPMSDGEEGGGASLGYRNRTYAYLDTGVEENALYQYRMAAWVRYRDPPAYVLRRLSGEWIARIETAGFEEDRLALPASRFADWDEAQARALGEEGIDQPPFPPVRAPDGSIRQDEPVRSLLPLLGEEPAAGPFAYTDIVLTPADRILRLNSVVTLPGGQDEEPSLAARMEITRIQPDGRANAETFTVSEPDVPALSPRDVFLTEGEGEEAALVRDADGRFRPRPLEQVYGGLEGLDLTPVGEEAGPFAAEWGLVDIRTCRVTLRRFRLVEVRPELERDLTPNDVRAIVNAVPELRRRVNARPDLMQRYLQMPRLVERYIDRVPPGTIPGLGADQIRYEREDLGEDTREHEYVVVRELNPPEGEAPQYRRILMQWPYGGDVEVRMVSEPDWYPALTRQAGGGGE